MRSPTTKVELHDIICFVCYAACARFGRTLSATYLAAKMISRIHVIERAPSLPNEYKMCSI